MNSILASARQALALLTPSQRRRCAWVCALIVIGLFLEVLSIGSVVPVIALMLQGDPRELHPWLAAAFAWNEGNQKVLVVAAVLTLFVIHLIKNLILALVAQQRSSLSFDVQRELSLRLFAGYLRQPWLFHLSRNSAELVRNATTEPAVFAHYALAPLLILLGECLILLAIGALALWVEPLGVFIVAIFLGGAAAIFHMATHNRIFEWGRVHEEQEGLRLQFLLQGLGAIKELIVSGRQDGVIAQYRPPNDGSARAEHSQNVVQQLPRLWLEFLAVSGLSVLVLTMLAHDRPVAAILPTAGLFAAAAFRLIPSANRVLASLHSIRFSTSVVRTLTSELSLLSATAAATRAQTPMQAYQGDIELRDVSCCYPGKPEPVLDALFLTIRAGECIGFHGPSGAGKTTLVDAVLGLLPLRRGAVFVGGQDIIKSPEAWRRHVGYVPQFVYLADDTIRRNVAFGLPETDIDNSAVDAALAGAQLTDFVAALPDGVETIVGECGARLSGGQRQRIGIARALYGSPQVLILDEATNSLDPETEDAVMEAVRALRGRVTQLIVSHRPSALAHCDRVFYLRRGRLHGNSDDAELQQMISTP
ncbi:MAG: ABC transporter ATP-binding protein [Pseudomonadota bacterium]